MRNMLTRLAALLLISSGAAFGNLIVTIPHAVLQPNTPNQEVVITVSGPDIVTNFNFRAAINDGVGLPGDVPVFQGPAGAGLTNGTDFLANGSIWNTHPTVAETGETPLWNPTPPPGPAFPLFAGSGIAFADNPGGPIFSVQGDGVLLTAIIDTTGVTSGTYPFTAGAHNISTIPGTAIGLNDSNFSNSGGQITTTFVNGSITVVPEPSPMLFGFLSLGMISCYRRRQSLFGTWFSNAA